MHVGIPNPRLRVKRSGIPGACTKRNFTYLVRRPFRNVAQSVADEFNLLWPRNVIWCRWTGSSLVNKGQAITWTMADLMLIRLSGICLSDFFSQHTQDLFQQNVIENVTSKIAAILTSSECSQRGLAHFVVYCHGYLPNWCFAWHLIRRPHLFIGYFS